MIWIAWIAASVTIAGFVVFGMPVSAAGDVAARDLPVGCQVHSDKRCRLSAMPGVSCAALAVSLSWRLALPTAPC